MMYVRLRLKMECWNIINIDEQGMGRRDRKIVKRTKDVKNIAKIKGEF